MIELQIPQIFEPGDDGDPHYRPAKGAAGAFAIHARLSLRDCFALLAGQSLRIEWTGGAIRVSVERA